MSDWNDFDFDLTENPTPDEYQLNARETLADFFEENKNKVYFGNQLAIMNEATFFHWITARALRDLIDQDLIRTENRKLAIGSELKLMWHRSYRYYKRDAKKIVGLVNEYGSPNMCASIGLHGEQMILAAFALRQFVVQSHNSRSYLDKAWVKTSHNLDFVFERDGQAYGVEVKNTLSYMDEEEFQIKIEMCEELGITPVFAVRMMPKSWIHELISRGGYAMILKYQLYPWTHRDLAEKVRTELGLPVDAPRRLADGTMDRFLKWHRARL
jgi:hypothetical protein